MDACASGTVAYLQDAGCPGIPVLGGSEEAISNRAPKTGDAARHDSGGAWKEDT